MKVKLTIFLFLLPLVSLFAQFPDLGSIGQSSGGGGASQREYVFDPDTFGVFYFYADNPYEETPFTDSLLNNFESYDPIRQQPLEYAHLGNVGSAARQLFFQPTFHLGYDIGFHQYDIYNITAKNTPYYRIKKNAFTRAYYSQQSQANTIFKGEYSRTFSDGITFSVDYRRMKNVGQYKFQETSNSAFATSWWFRSKGGRYDGYLSFNSNTNTEQDNGGVDLEAVTDQLLLQPFTVPVNIDAGSNTTHISQEYSYTHYFKVIGGPPRRKKKKEAEAIDSLKTFPFLLPDSLEAAGADSILADSLIRNRSIDSTAIQLLDSLPPVMDTLRMDTIVNDSLDKKQGRPSGQKERPDGIQQGRPKQGNRPRPGSPPSGRPSFTGPPPTENVMPTPVGPPKRAFTAVHQISYKRSVYKFADITPDTSYYGKFAVHRRGLRHFVNHKKLENSFRLQTSKPRSNNENVIRSQQDLLEVGLTHSIHFIDLEVEKNKVNNLFLTGKWHFSPSERLKVKTYAHLGFWDNAGDYRLSGDFFFDLKSAGKLQLKALSQSYSPTLVQQKLFISGQFFWENNFSKTFETSLSAKYTIPFVKVEVTGHYHLINNYLYFDTLAMPQQTGTAINIGQLILKKNFKLWRFHLDNTFILQQNSSDLLRLPKYYSINSLYFEGRLLGEALFSRIGVDFRLNGAFQADRFHALTGQFRLQDDLLAPVYPALDVFISLKVERFRFFAKWENVLDQTLSDLYYLSANNPQRYLGFQFGISWRFRN